MARVLLVEDSPSDAVLIGESLRAYMPDSDITVVTTIERGAAELRGDEGFDCVVLDLNLPDGRGIDTLAVFRGLHPMVPIVVVSGQDDEHLGLDTIAVGADDFLPKGSLEARHNPLGHCVQAAVGRSRLRSMRRYSHPIGYDALRSGVLSVLVVEDDSSMQYLIGRQLQEVADLLEVQLDLSVASTVAEVLAIDVDRAPACVLLDLNLPDSEGLQTVATVRGMLPRSSLIVLSSDVRADIGVAALDLGADDALIKGEPSIRSLARTIQFSFQRRRQALEQLTHAQRDVLTGLPGRGLLLDAMAAGMERLASGGTESLAVIFMDLDGFKQINDQLGHAVGDNVLRIIAGRLAKGLRIGDVLGRLGGDEFVIVTTDLNLADVEALAGRVAQEVAEPLRLDPDYTALLTISYGIMHTTTVLDPAALLDDADRRMYLAKLARRGEGVTDRRRAR